MKEVEEQRKELEEQRTELEEQKIELESLRKEVETQHYNHDKTISIVRLFAKLDRNSP